MARPLARRTEDDLKSASWVREMFDRARRLTAERGPANVCDLSIGQPFAPPPDAFYEAAEAVARERRPEMHRYMPNAGILETRTAIAALVREEYGWDIDADALVLTTGTASGLNIVLRAICDPGDEVLLIAPYFPEYRPYVRHAGATPVDVRAAADFQPDIDALAAAITPRTRAVIVNSPNNPTGVIYSAEHCRALAELLKRHDHDERPIYLLIDDPYRRLVFDGRKPPSPGDHYPRTILASSFSKDLSIAGERLGYLVLPPALPERKRLLAAFTMLNRTLGMVNAPAFMQRVLARCASARCDVDFYRRNRDRLCRGLQAAGYELPWPGGAMFAFPRTPGDDLAFTEALLEQGVIVVPGRGFSYPGHVRVSFAVDPQVIDRALPILARVLHQQRSAAPHAEIGA